GFTFQDIDNDSDLDVLITGYHGSKLYRNNGEGRFNLIRRFAGLHYTGAFGDVDLDGDLDLYIAGDAGIYLNDGAGEFGLLEGIGLDGIGVDARSAVFADMDNDGDLDLLIASKQGSNTFFINEASTGGWLKVALTGTNGEKGAIGATAALYEAGRAGEAEALVGFRAVQSATGYCSQDPSLLHFGVDPAGSYDLRITFKEGTVATRTGLSPRQTVEVGGH
ncbi:MAG: FG-GAP-like repeat-containing protein, partial [Vicinamibacteria bacterium]